MQLSTDLITDFEVGRALEWLQEKREVTRVHGAAFLLRELSRAVPTLFAKVSGGKRASWRRCSPLSHAVVMPGRCLR